MPAAVWLLKAYFQFTMSLEVNQRGLALHWVVSVLEMVRVNLEVPLVTFTSRRPCDVILGVSIFLRG